MTIHERVTQLLAQLQDEVDPEVDRLCADDLLGALDGAGLAITTRETADLGVALEEHGLVVVDTATTPLLTLLATVLEGQ
jgi:hypothetical protein